MSKIPQETAESSTTGIGRFMQSEIYQLVAKDGARFFVNKDVLTSQSAPFREAITGPWREASNRTIELSDWDSATVGRLVEFLYTGDYSYPDPYPVGRRPLARANILVDDARVEVTDEQFDPGRPPTPPNEWFKKSLPKLEAPVSESERLSRFDPAGNHFEDVLIAHAKVYAMANYKSVDSLRALALKRMQITLMAVHPIQPKSHIAVNVANFVDYVYDNTDKLSLSEEPLRKLTSRFIALNLVAFQTNSKALQIFADGGDFVIDVISKVCETLPDPSRPVRRCPKEGYISSIKVVYGTSLIPPRNCIKEFRGLSSNLCYPQGPPNTVWLVPERTMEAGDACTKLAVRREPDENNDGSLRPRVGLHCINERRVMEKITEVFLLRCPEGEGLSVKVIRQFDGMTADLVGTFRSGALYLLWKSIKTDPA